MNEETLLLAAMDYCSRFLGAADAHLRTKTGKGGYPYPSKQRASVRRASMDLTRSLAAFRRAPADFGVPLPKTENEP
jgi:hypothetical protein